MQNFKNWLAKLEYYGGSASNPSGVEDEGDGGDGVKNKLERPGAFPTYGGDDLPITPRNKKRKEELPLSSKRSIYRGKDSK